MPSFTCADCGGTYVGYRDRDQAMQTHAEQCPRRIYKEDQ